MMSIKYLSIVKPQIDCTNDLDPGLHVLPGFYLNMSKSMSNHQVCISNHTIFCILQHFLVDLQKPILSLQMHYCTEFPSGKERTVFAGPPMVRVQILKSLLFLQFFAFINIAYSVEMSRKRRTAEQLVTLARLMLSFGYV